MFPIVDVNDLELAFGGDTARLLPPYADIPDEFKHGHGTWNQLVSAWFFRGIADLKLMPKDGVDQKKALRHIRAVMVSFDPKHEHKEAGCAFLFSQWFTSATWTARGEATSATCRRPGSAMSAA